MAPISQFDKGLITELGAAIKASNRNKYKIIKQLVSLSVSYQNEILLAEPTIHLLCL